jgi:hypothetical protein
MKKRFFAFGMALLLLFGCITPALPVSAAEVPNVLEEESSEPVLEEVKDGEGIGVLNVLEEESSEQSVVAVYVDDGKGEATELVNTSKTDEEGGWSLDGETGTLTLSGFAGKSIYALGDLKIVLDGENTITVPADLGYGIKADGALTIDDTTSPAEDSLTVSVTDATVSTTLLETCSYGQEEAVTINGGTVTLKGTSKEAALYGIGRWAYFYNDAIVSVDLSDEGNREFMAGMNSAVYSYTSGTVSVSIDSTYDGSYGAYSFYTGESSGNIELTAKGASHNIENTFSLNDDMTGNVTVKGYLTYLINASKAKWTVQGQDSFLWRYYTKPAGGFYGGYICDSTGAPLKDFVLVKSESNLPFKFMDSALFDMPEGKVGVAYNQRPYWVEGCVGGTGDYTFALAEDSAPLPDGLSVDATNGYIKGEPTAPHDAGVAKIKVTSGGESATFKVNYGAITWNVLVESMSLDKKEIILNQEESVDLVATILPVNADSCDVSWTVDLQYLRDVDKTAGESNQRAVTLTALNKAGKTKVTATTEIGNLKNSCDVYIKEKKPEAYVTTGGRYIGGLKEGATYLINDTLYTPEAMIGFDGYGVAMDTDWAGTTVTIVRVNAEEKCNSDVQSLAVPTALIPEKLTLEFPAPVLDGASAEHTQVVISDTTYGYVITDILVSCPQLNWSPYDRYFKGGTEYTATLALHALGDLTFPEDIEVSVDSGDVGITSLDCILSVDKKIITVTVVYEETVPDGLWMEEIPVQYYNGKALKPEVNVYYRDQLLTEEDYSISYKNNINAAASDAVNAKGKSIAPTVIIKGKGNFTGSVSKTFTINPVNLDDYKADKGLQKILTISPVYMKYTGNKLNGVPAVKFNGKTLSVKSKEYSLEYKDTATGAYQENGEYDITIVGAGKNFIGSTTVKQYISGKLISKVKITLDKSSYPYNADTGKTYPETITVKDGTTILEKDVDYTVSFADYEKIGTATAIITGKGDYTGVATKTYKITGTKLTSKMVKQLEHFVYEETEHSVAYGVNYTISDNEVALVEGLDYTISYSGDRTNAGKFKVTFTGIKKYTGSVTKTYTISKAQASEFNVVLDNADAVPYSKNGATPDVKVYFGSDLLCEGTEYKVTYTNNKKIASASDKKAPSLYVTGVGNFTGNTKNASIKFTIVGADISKQNAITTEDVLYKNKKNNYIPKLSVSDKNTGKKLAIKTDYKIVGYKIWDETRRAYKAFEGDKVDASGERVKMSVTVEGVGNFSGSFTSFYEVYPKSITTVKVDKIPSAEYTGKEITPVPVVTVKTKVGNKTQYVPLDPACYEVEYSNNIEKGTATVFILGKGEYGGVKKVTFKITGQKMSWWEKIF